MNHNQEHHNLPYGLFIKIWLALIVLTGITVGVCYLDMQKWTIFTAMLVATVKAALVILFFMHIRYEKPIIKWMVLILIATYAVFIILTFSDYSFR